MWSTIRTKSKSERAFCKILSCSSEVSFHASKPRLNVFGFFTNALAIFCDQPGSLMRLRISSYSEAYIINGEYPPGVFFKGSQIFWRKFKGSQINFKVWPNPFAKFPFFWKIHRKNCYNFSEIRGVKILGFSGEYIPGGYSPIKMTTPYKCNEQIFNNES